MRKLRRDGQQAAFNSETKRAVQAVTGVEGHGLKPWREVIRPHQDVAIFFSRHDKLKPADNRARANATTDHQHAAKSPERHPAKLRQPKEGLQ